LGGTWSPDGHSIVFSIDRRGIYEVSASGGAPKIIIQADRFAPGNHCDSPYLVPSGSGRNLLCAAQRKGEIHDLVLLSLDSGKRSVLVPNAYDAHVVYSPTGHLLYEYPSSGVNLIMALPFSLATMKATGDAFPIAGIGSWPSVSRDGTLVYQTGAGLPELQLNWHDRSGNRGDKVAALGPGLGWAGVNRLSPDGRSVALTAARNSKVEIWIFDVTRGTKTRLTSSQWDAGPIWSRSGKEITFASNRQGHVDIYTTPADGSGEAKPLVVGPVNKVPTDWSPDGRFLIYQTFSEKTQSDLWYLRPKQDGSGYEPVPFLRTAAKEWGGKFSPDGRFLAYVSDESGRTEICVRRFPDGSGKQQISVNGGTSPSWRKDGKELFYLENDTLVAVSVATTPDFSIGATRRLFTNSSLGNGYGASTDGQRFLLVEPTQPVPPTVFRVVENWFAEFRDRAAR
jgi:Tol biopolymer transport system component